MMSSRRTVVETANEAAPSEELARATKPGPLIGALILRVCVIAALAFAAYVAVRRGVAAWYFSKNDPPDVELAVRWDPQNPQYADALAHLVQFYSENPNPSRSVQLLETATRLSPDDAHYWADLGSAYDQAGRREDAIRAFETARRLFPRSPDINWRLANFYVRAKRANDAVPLLKSVLEEQAVDDRQVFALADRAGLAANQVAGEMLPPRGQAYVDYLNFQLAAGNLEPATEVWTQLLKSQLPFRPGDAFAYFDALLRDKQVDAISQVWHELAGRFPKEIGPRTSARNLVTNGDFDFPILDGGFDWRVIPTDGATVRIDPAGKLHSSGFLRIDFDGRQNLEYGGVLEFIEVQPGARYEFSAEARADEITTDSGPRFQLYDEYSFQKLFVSAPNQVGTSAWTPVHMGFHTGPGTHLIVLRIARPASEKFDNKIRGTFWVRHVSLLAKEDAQPPESGKTGRR
jgi:Tetratricopeptide repeat